MCIQGAKTQPAHPYWDGPVAILLDAGQEFLHDKCESRVERLNIGQYAIL
jgi:hypothetical protein